MNGSRSAALAAAAGLVLLLGGCAATPEVDLEAAKRWLDDVRAAESDGPGDAGIAAMKIGPPTDQPDSIRFDYPAPTQLVGVDARCYGEDGADVTAQVTLTVSPADGSAAISVPAEVPCDRDPHGIDLDAPPAEAILIEAAADADTYLHATVIQELVIER